MRTVALVPSVDRPTPATRDHGVARSIHEAERLVLDRVEAAETTRPATDQKRPALGNAGVVDIVDEVLATALLHQHQLGVLVGLVGTVRPGDEVVADVIEEARRFGHASDAAIGAAATLVGAIRTGDESAIGGCLSKMLACFDEEELVAGAAALAAALATAIAEALDIDATDAFAVLVEAVWPTPTAEETAAHFARTRPHLVRRNTGRTPIRRDLRSCATSSLTMS